MITLTKTSPIPSVDQTLEILRANNNLMPIYIDYDKTLMSLFSMQRQLDALYNAFKEITGLDARTGVLKKYMLTYASQRGFLHTFARTDSGDYSVAADSISGVMHSNIDENDK
ncbi:MAG: hypothetical protein NC131_13070, partial [Roseburia sp.]|nr:hypothetical protein [Roseburia sp.]